MKFYNTKTRNKDQFKPLSSREVKVYFCWPTPYNFAHIWNLKTYVWNDIVVKTLKFLGYNVKTTMNITDIDDKTIRDSGKVWEKLLSFTKKYTEAFIEDIEKLWIEKTDNIVPISGLIPEMVRMINTLLRKWYAYLSDDGSVYFSIKKFKKYWQLANLDMGWMKESVRIDNDEYDKDNAWDFALWKVWNKSDWENFWEWTFEIPQPNSLIQGEETVTKEVVVKWRPGWHIECSACNMKYFGKQIDLHMWWIDNLFPHHQNEVAQTEWCTWKEFSKYWIHHWHLTVNGKKMSKSAWNFYTLRDLEEKFSKVDKSILYRAIRLNFINWKYRSSIDLSFEKIEANINNVTSIDETLKNLKNYNPSSANEWTTKDFSDYMQDIIQSYSSHLEDDFNVPEVLVLVYDLLKFVNIWIRNNDFSKEEVDSILDMFKTINYVLWIFDFTVLEKEYNIPSDILEKLEDRNDAKKNKNFSLADKLRNEIESLGYKIVDSREGSRVEKI